MRLLLFFLITSMSVSAQLKGTITDIDNNPIPYVNIYIENSYEGTTSNENGDYEFKYDERAVNAAATTGHIDILEWFYNSKYEFKYNDDARSYAENHDHINVLEWFKQKGYEFGPRKPPITFDY